MTGRVIARLAGALAHAWTWGMGWFWGYRASMIAIEGIEGLMALLLPILVSGLFLVVVLAEPGGRAVTMTVLWVTAVLMMGFCVLAGFSIGLLYIPGAVAMLIAAAFAASSTASSESPPAGRVTRGCL